MARRQPSSVLSICMSRILDTSSVNTLQRKRATTAVQSDCAPPAPAGKTLRTGSLRPEARPCGPRESCSPLDVAFLPPT